MPLDLSTPEKKADIDLIPIDNHHLEASLKQYAKQNTAIQPFRLTY